MVSIASQLPTFRDILVHYSFMTYYFLLHLTLKRLMYDWIWCTYYNFEILFDFGQRASQFVWRAKIEDNFIAGVKGLTIIELITDISAALGMISATGDVSEGRGRCFKNGLQDLTLLVAGITWDVGTSHLKSPIIQAKMLTRILCNNSSKDDCCFRSTPPYLITSFLTGLFGSIVMLLGACGIGINSTMRSTRITSHHMWS